MDSQKGIAVAIVDDDPSLCRSLARLLKASGFEPASFPSAESFLDQRTEPFGCLILDIQLGGMSGLELRRQLSNEGIALPVIYLTASDDPDIRRQAMESGCSAYFQKSDPGSAILESIRGAITPHQTSI